eukprot:CAMPEP_0201491610 /NCGR_PEP_ID=MMETSP0151_2-20130828/30455_1 /ASSEMBLY_ACC=CAM_ASM_000257 /TAXON_ID=200890 /ORGANISM="Paramoeba atlantica, Strain 621/1 / CCAP 1560/9" /LENGTH=102 /DNA_ID=CAMNT_0047878037 /DNA_START=638 /DNA_END=943 /DNA_ORIENTATION=+
MSGEKIAASDAFRLGVVSKVVSQPQLDDEVKKYATELLSSAPRAMATIKGLVQFNERHTSQENREEVKRIFREMMGSEEAMHGISSFAQKQKPDWAPFRKAK